MTFFEIFLACIILQRIVELFISKRNAKVMFQKGAEEFDKKGYPLFIVLHTSFFISLIFEYLYFKPQLNNFWIIFLMLFIAAQLLRYWAIYSLGTYWNTKIIVLKHAELISKGPYRFMHHPNYLAVIIELAAVPLLFSCYYTAIIFSILNLVILKRRVKIEEKVLSV